MPCVASSRSCPAVGAAAIKRRTLLEMEAERIESAKRIQISGPGILRGLDQLWVPTREGISCVLVLADGAVPYRTTVERIARYDGMHVADVLERDLERHGAPLVLRLDRAKAHDVPSVQDVCARHGVLVLHGPPRRPQYYGQLERQNREHRAWLDAGGPLREDELAAHLGEMVAVLNGLWPRRTLNWSTSEVLWNCRRNPSVDRAALRERVAATSIRLARDLPPKAIALGTHHRLAIEHEFGALGLLEQQHGGWC